MTEPTRIFSLSSIYHRQTGGSAGDQHAEGARGTRGNGKKAVKKLESKYLKITNETIRATGALAFTSMTSGQDPDKYITNARDCAIYLPRWRSPSRTGTSGTSSTSFSMV